MDYKSVATGSFVAFYIANPPTVSANGSFKEMGSVRV